MRNQENPLYNRAKKFLMRRVNYENFVSIPYDQMATSLQRVREFLAFLGSPQNEFAIVHVAGTKGKGGVCHSLDRIYRSAGYRVGLFTSPHLDDLSERFQIDGQPCDKTLFAETTSLLAERWKRFRREERRRMKEEARTRGLDGEPQVGVMTFFEWTLALALALFARAKVDIAVLEVGLGGRFDATNACCADVSVLTSVSFDHCEQLGDTLEKIASEKLGIVKTNAPLVCGVALTESLCDGYENFLARESRCRALRVDEYDEDASLPATESADLEKRLFDEKAGDSPLDFTYMVDPQTLARRADLERVVDLARATAQERGAQFYSVEKCSRLVASLPNPPFDFVRKWNFEIALKVVDVLANRDFAPQGRPGSEPGDVLRRFPVSEKAILQAADRFNLPARFEIVAQKPLIVVDGAHNRASVAAFLRAVRERWPDKKLKTLFAPSLKKDARGMLAELATYADEIYLTERSRDARSTPLADLIQIHENLLDETCVEDSALRRKFRVAPDFRAFLADYCARPSTYGDVMCALGSFYFAADVRRAINKTS